MSEQNYILHCGDKKYEVTPKVQKILEGAMYWSHCEKLDTAELYAAEKKLAERQKDGCSEEEIAKRTAKITELKREVEQEGLTIKGFMSDMEKHGVPNWVGNGALAFGKENDLREHSTREFFVSGKYSEKENPEKKKNKSKSEDYER